MSKAVVCKIRPITWKICVQSEASTQYVRAILSGAGFRCTETKKEPDRHDPAVYSFTAAPKSKNPISPEELIALLEHDANIEVAFTEQTEE